MSEMELKEPTRSKRIVTTTTIVTRPANKSVAFVVDEEEGLPSRRTVTQLVSSSPDPLLRQSRQGTLCCGCCCDFRRAVIIVCLILIIISIVGGILYLTGNHYSIRGINGDYQDTIGLQKYWTIAGALSLVGIIFHAFAIYGALVFNAWYVGAGLFWLVAGLIASLGLGFKAASQFEEDNPAYEIQYNPSAVIVGVAVMLLFAYPHILLVVYIHKGIMSPETYTREKHSCCCVSPEPYAGALVEDNSIAEQNDIEQGRDEEYKQGGTVMVVTPVAMDLAGPSSEQSPEPCLESDSNLEESEDLHFIHDYRKLLHETNDRFVKVLILQHVCRDAHSQLNEGKVLAGEDAHMTKHAGRVVQCIEQCYGGDVAAFLADNPGDLSHFKICNKNGIKHVGHHYLYDTDEHASSPLLRAPVAHTRSAKGTMVEFSQDYRQLLHHASDRLVKVLILQHVCRDTRSQLQQGKILEGECEHIAKRAARVVQCIQECHGGDIDTFLAENPGDLAHFKVCSRNVKHIAHHYLYSEH